MLLLYAAACDRAADTIPPKEPFIFQPPYIVDTLSGTVTPCGASKWIGSAGILPVYLGPSADTLDITARQISDKYLIPDEFSFDELYPFLQDSGLYIFVDTAHRIWHNTLLFKVPTPENPQGGSASPDFELHDSYPVFIVNTLADTITVGERYKILTVLEAMDAQGKWRPIEKSMPDCGTGSVYLRLPPSEMVIAALNVCPGDFSTQLRLRYNNMYSNSWHGSVYLSQFYSR